MQILKHFINTLPSQTAYAHCDVPCGIYDPKSAQIAAATVLKMVQKINDLPLPDFQNQEQVAHYQNSLTRYIWTKEEHARKCKEELLILWTDYFKPEHLKMFPNLHEIFWKAAKLCSENKQHVSLEKAQELVDQVNRIAEIFGKAKTATPVKK